MCNKQYLYSSVHYGDVGGRKSLLSLGVHAAYMDSKLSFMHIYMH